MSSRATARSTWSRSSPRAPWTSWCGRGSSTGWSGGGAKRADAVRRPARRPRRVGRDRVLQELHARPPAHRGRGGGGRGADGVRRRVRAADHLRGAHRAPGPDLPVGARPGARAHRAREAARPRDPRPGDRAPARPRGAEVLLVTGPTELPLPLGVTAHRVETTAELQRAVGALVKQADVLIMAAAPADYRPTTVSPTKRARGGGTLTLELEATPDILATLERPRPRVVVGFALEAGGDGVARARKKLQDKALDLVILNDALAPGAGFEFAKHRVTIHGQGV